MIKTLSHMPKSETCVSLSKVTAATWSINKTIPVSMALVWFVLAKQSISDELEVFWVEFSMRLWFFNWFFRNRFWFLAEKVFCWGIVLFMIPDNFQQQEWLEFYRQKWLQICLLVSDCGYFVSANMEKVKWKQAVPM